jgi:hypothetical protein
MGRMDRMRLSCKLVGCMDVNITNITRSCMQLAPPTLRCTGPDCTVAT